MILFALAAGGGSIAYVPLLTVLLPLKVTALMGSEDVGALARVTFYGAIVASAANIAFGILSDRSRNRIGWILFGLVTSSLLLIAIGKAASLVELIVLVMLWQIGLNMMLGPLFAWAGDCFPDDQKGLLGGLLAVAPAMGAVAGSLVTFERIVSVEYRLYAVAALVGALVLPALIFGRNQSRPRLLHTIDTAGATAREPDGSALQTRSIVARMWGARFLVQIAEAGLFAFLLFWLRSIVEDFHENTAANVFSLVLIVSVPISLWLGRWSDRQDRPMAPLVACSAVAAAGLVMMALATEISFAIGSFVVFGIAATIFLSLHTGQTLRVLPKPQNRGRDLGIFNLTNTVPSLVMPWLTLMLVPSFGFAALFAFFAALAALAAGLLATALKRA
ncbi:MAG: MFS transporter [Erythrobacter sp.]|nr:MFS transporter [Erythrobacter sp.]